MTHLAEVIEVSSQINVRVPESLRAKARKAAQQQGVSVNQFCALAIAYAVGEEQAREFFQRRARGLSAEEGRAAWAAVLTRVRRQVTSSTRAR